MTPALIPAKSLKTTCDSYLAGRWNQAVFSLPFRFPTTCPSKKLKFRPPMEKPRPALRGGVRWPGAPKRPPAFILHIFRPPGSRRHKLRIIRPAASGKAHSLRCSSSPNRNRCAGLRFGRKRRLVIFRIAERPHSGAQAVTLSAHYHCGARVPLRLADVQPPCPSAPTAVRRTGRGPAGSGGWCRADCRCASDQSWW